MTEIGNGDNRVNSILNALMDFANGDTGIRLSQSDNQDDLDAVCEGINMLFEELAARKEALETAQGHLLETSRRAGMAEVATGVLHNIGNVLTSVTVNANLIDDICRQSKTGGLVDAMALVEKQDKDLGRFFSEGHRGIKLLAYLKELSVALNAETNSLRSKTTELLRNLDQARAIIALQQKYAFGPQKSTWCHLEEVIDDSIAINKEGLKRHGVSLLRVLEPVPRVKTEKHRLVQIVVNLISNAKYALSQAPADNRILRVQLKIIENNQIQIIIQDNGIGIPAENIDKIFQFGFTTRLHGHGFGLHSARNSAWELGAALTFHSDGPGKGATFFLTLPSDREEIQNG